MPPAADPRYGMRPCRLCRALTQWITLAGVEQCWWCGAVDDASRPKAGRESEEGGAECWENDGLSPSYTP